MKRKPNNEEYHAYLQSSQWRNRRQEWWDEELSRNGKVRCFVTRVPVADLKDIHIHHMSYDGVMIDGDHYVSGEPHEDLVAIYPEFHRALHDYFDEMPGTRNLYFNRRATTEQWAQTMQLRAIRGLLFGETI